MSLKQKFSSLNINEWLLIGLAVSLPFEFIPSKDIYGLTFRISTVLAILLIFISLVKLYKAQLSLKVSLSVILLLIWLGWLGIGVMWSGDTTSWLKSFLPIGYMVSLALSVAINTKKELLFKILRALLFGAFISSIFGLYQFFGNYGGLSEQWTGLRDQYSWQRFGFPRMQGPALEPLYFSAYLMLPILLLINLFWQGREFIKKSRLGILGLLIFINILTLSRGGLAALIIGVALSLLLVGSIAKRRMLKAFIFGIIGIAIAFGLALVIIGAVARKGEDKNVTYGKQGDATVLAHLTNFHFFASSSNKQKDDSISQRQRARNQAFLAIKDYPRVLIAGTGIGQYHKFVNSHYANADLGEPNNLIIEQVTTTGLIGFGLFISVTTSLLFGLWRTAKATKDNLTRSICLGLVAYLVSLGIQAQTFTGLLLTHLWFAIGLALFLVQLPVDKKVDSSGRQKKVTKIRTN